MRFGLFFAILLFGAPLTTPLFAQLGEISGRCIDYLNKEPVPFVVIQLHRSEQFQEATQTDSFGVFSFSGLQPGSYRIIATYTGKHPDTTDITLSRGSSAFREIRMADNELPPVIVRTPLISKDDEVVTVTTVTSEEIIQSAASDPISTAVRQSPYVKDSDGDPGRLHVAGSRDNAVAYYVDGVRVIGSFNMPRRSISEINFYTLGIPARYGDVTGGVVEIWTKSYMDF
jgi:hypothetical protein